MILGLSCSASSTPTTVSKAVSLIIRSDGRPDFKGKCAITVPGHITDAIAACNHQCNMQLCNRKNPSLNLALSTSLSSICFAVLCMSMLWQRRRPRSRNVEAGFMQGQTSINCLKEHLCWKAQDGCSPVRPMASLVVQALQDQQEDTKSQQLY